MQIILLISAFDLKCKGLYLEIVVFNCCMYTLQPKEKKKINKITFQIKF